VSLGKPHQKDQWLVYSVSTQSGDARKLLIGYDLQIKDWFGFTLKDKDLGVIYLDCDECEPASLFTALHYDPREGWRARWANEKSPDHPGITLRVTDVGDPYTNEDVDQVFAVITPKNGVASPHRTESERMGIATLPCQGFMVESCDGSVYSHLQRAIEREAKSSEMNRG
jgi:hypothetical protein